MHAYRRFPKRSQSLVTSAPTMMVCRSRRKALKHWAITRGPFGTLIVRQRLPRLVLGLLCLVAVILSSMPIAEAKSSLDVPLVVTQVPRGGNLPPAEWQAGRMIRSDWFEGARLVIVSPEGPVRILTEGFHSACDPCLSFDGQRMLFAGKKESQSRWRIYEMGLDGQGLRPVSPEHQQARSPIYATTLFTLDSPEPWFTVVYVAKENYKNESGQDGGASLYNIRLDGTELRRVTYNPNHDMDPFQMWDGRVLYAAERYPFEPGAPDGHIGLYSIHLVGTEGIFYGGKAGKRIQQMPCATDQGVVFFVESEAGAWDGAGQLASLREQRPHHTYQALTGDAEWRYLYPAPWRGNQILVSRRSADGRGTSEVCLFEAGSRQCEPVFDSPDFHDVQAQAVRSRPLPDGHSTVVEPGKYTTGIIYGLNCYEAEERMRPHLAKGVFKRLRVIEGVPANPEQMAGSTSSAVLPSSGEAKGPFVARRLLGEAPMELDGSFHIEAPADTPLQLQALDERGLALATCGWIWVKPRERRGCIGCHEDPELVPENHFVLALRRSASQLTPPPAERWSVDFVNDVRPILKNRCASVECHGMSGSPLYLPVMASRPALQDLQQAFFALRSVVEGGPGSGSPIPQRGKYIDAGRARTSPLVWRLLGRDTSRPWDLPPGQTAPAPRKVNLMPPPGKGGPLSDEELRILIEWIDLGAAWEAKKGSPLSEPKPEEDTH